MVSSMDEGAKTDIAKRLRRIEGQVRGIGRMVEEDRYCIDVLHQLQAVRAALHKVEEKILKDHVHHCVANAFASGDAADQNAKIQELIDVVGRLTK